MAEPAATMAFDSPRGWRAFGRYVLLAVVTFVVLFPVYTTVIAAFKPTDRVLLHPLVPDAFTLDVFREAWTEGHLGRYLFNSLVVAIIVTLGQVVSSVLSGYAFAMLDFPGKDVVFVVFLATLLVPLEATVVANRLTIDRLGWLNSYQGLTVPFLATAFGTFLVRQVLLTLPRDLRDAALIDGVSHVGYLRHIAVPLIRPTLGALALFSFLGTWNAVPVAQPDHDRAVDEHRAVGPASAQGAVARCPEPADGGHDHRRRPDLCHADDLPASTRARPHRRRGQGLTGW